MFILNYAFRNDYVQPNRGGVEAQIHRSIVMFLKKSKKMYNFESG